jgi:cytochrome c oxidase cbb3-type subunit 2
MQRAWSIPLPAIPGDDAPMTPLAYRSARAIAIAALAVVGAGGLGAARGRLAAQPPPPAPESAARGKAVYENRCVECHGSSGKGDGSASPMLTPRPRDFTLGRFKIRSTESGSLPTDDDLLRSVRQGLYGSAMPAWDKILSDAEIQDVVAYVKGFSPRFTTEATSPVALGAQVPSSPDSIARGQETYARLKCSSCHGVDGRGTGAIAVNFEDDWKRPLNAANLSEPWVFHGGSTSRDIYLRFRTGMSGTPMPSFKDAATDAEMWDLANYVVSLARKPVWSMTADEITAQYQKEAAEAKADPVKRGRYLVDTHLCALCHSPIDENGRILDGLKFAGGQLIRIVPFGDYPTGNLTSDKETGLGTWTDDELKRVITTGVRRNGARLPPFPMDWPAFSSMTPEDLNAMVAYIRTIPPISNKIPETTRPFLPVYLWGKFKMLILQQDPPTMIYPGNVGTPGGQR